MLAGQGGQAGNCEEVIDESDYWKETQIHGSKVFLLDIVDIVAFFFQKCYVQAQKSDTVIRTETELCEEASRRKQSLTKGMHLNRYHISSRKKFRSDIITKQ